MGSDISTEKGAEKASSTQSKDATTLAQKLRKSRTARLNKILKADSVASDHADGDDDDEVSQNICGGSDPELKERAQQEDPKDYQFSFDNLVFEGGGAKGAAYIGALKYLEECGVLGQIRRFGGASVGAMTAMCLACGFTPQEIEENPIWESMLGLDTDHRPVITTLVTQKKRKFTKKKKQSERLDMHKLQDEDVQTQIRCTISETLDCIDPTTLNVEEAWGIFTKKTGGRNRKATAWWNKEVKDAIKKEKKLYKTWVKSKDKEDYIKYRLARRHSKKVVRTAKEKSWTQYGEKLCETCKTSPREFLQECESDESAR
ncbi:hypothetical protein ACOMHN_023011 [Nucella lapillus]